MSFSIFFFSLFVCAISLGISFMFVIEGMRKSYLTSFVMTAALTLTSLYCAFSFVNFKHLMAWLKYDEVVVIDKYVVCYVKDGVRTIDRSAIEKEEREYAAAGFHKIYSSDHLLDHLGSLNIFVRNKPSIKDKFEKMISEE